MQDVQLWIVGYGYYWFYGGKGYIYYDGYVDVEFLEVGVLDDGYQFVVEQVGIDEVGDFGFGQVECIIDDEWYGNCVGIYYQYVLYVEGKEFEYGQVFIYWMVSGLYGIVFWYFLLMEFGM